MYDVTYNRVYWRYPQTDSFMRPTKGYLCTPTLPTLGCRVTVPFYKKCGDNIRTDYEELVTQFAKQYPNNKFVMSMSGGIDSEFCAETFYNLKIPFRAVSLRLFNGENDHDLLYAAKYCKDRDIDLKIHNISYDELCNTVIAKACKYGQFTHSPSQVALTHLFDFVGDDEILINSGHNPDYCNNIGFGWWEDSPNMVKYAINTNKKFMTFTSLEPIFVHYTKNYDSTQPGEKDNGFLYEQYPHLKERTKMTGWETATTYALEAEKLIRSECNEAVNTFVTWNVISKKRKKDIEKQLDKYFADKQELNKLWTLYKLITGVELGRY